MEFKIGDRVKIVNTHEGFLSGFEYGDIVTIISIDDTNPKYHVMNENHHTGWANMSGLEKVEFTKDKLQKSDIITLRNGDRLILDKEGIFRDLGDDNDNYVSSRGDFNDDLTYDDDDTDYDIVKVERATVFTTVYEREEKEVKEMTIAEISKALGYEVKIVKEDK